MIRDFEDMQFFFNYVVRTDKYTCTCTYPSSQTMGLSPQAFSERENR